MDIKKYMLIFLTFISLSSSQTFANSYYDLGQQNNQIPLEQNIPIVTDINTSTAELGVAETSGSFYVIPPTGGTISGNRSQACNFEQMS